MKQAAFWYYDVVSPYAYLQLKRFSELEDRLEVTPVPVLFAGLLGAWGQLGPAEIPAKRVQTYRYAHWLATRRGLPFRAPPRHPFNPLAILRMAIAAGSTVAVTHAVFDHVWGRGEDGEDPKGLERLAVLLGIGDVAETVNDPAIKDRLRGNTDDAVAAGVYGVPTFRIGESLFWGDDLTDMMIDWLDDPDMLDAGEYRRLGALPTASVRQQSRLVK
ncbi:2-hydroxychromene-2-carboxylate isomerase [Minwuia sp.]|uniref:2-hydroxychromene-2-carboxylate isomerase n=1 Tax=Minwuia sp. TaxID=2493630 RepID=UPI003A91B7CE